MQYLKQICFSLVFFTRIRIPFMLDFYGISLGAVAWTYPLIGLLVGGFAAFVWWGAGALGFSALVAAWLAVGASVLLTGALHEDGLADTADGMAAHRDAARKLDIMRDSRIGAYGVMALVVVLSLRAALYAEVTNFLIIIACAVVSRVAIAGLMFTTPRAREEGMASLAGAPSKLSFAVCVKLALLIVALLVGVAEAFMLLAVLALSAYAVRRVAMRHFGGITGDVLGASQQLSELALLMALVALSQAAVG